MGVDGGSPSAVKRRFRRLFGTAESALEQDGLADRFRARCLIEARAKADSLGNDKQKAADRGQRRFPSGMTNKKAEIKAEADSLRG